jgi:leader peptidase (prepilin peptidase) / N-methyltransferase
LFEPLFALLSEPAFLMPVLFVFGAAFGSFANVVIYRMPKGESVAFPSSFCRSCNTTIKWYNNIPIVSWFFLRGKCAKCGAKYSFRYPAVELLMGVLFAMAGYAVGFNWTLLESLIFIFCVTTASFIDLDLMILPDKFTLSGIVIGLLGAWLNPERAFLPALIGAAAGFAFLYAIAYLYIVFRDREGMGGGDIKLIAWIGAVLGWKSIPFVILVSSILGSVIGIALATRTKGGMTQAIPFGPFLAGAALIYLLFDGAGLANWYLALHGL